MAPKLRMLYKVIGDEANLTPKQVSQCLKALQSTLAKELLQGRSVNIPILANTRMKKITARPECSKSVFGKTVLIKAREERKEVRMRPSKALQVLCSIRQ